MCAKRSEKSLISNVENKTYERFSFLERILQQIGIMATKEPFFSIVIPTRDRPFFVKASLEALTLQSYKNFEVIISDNFVNNSCRSVVEEFDDSRFKYVRPPRDMHMSEHWEFACEQMTGDYLTVLIDKTFLHVDALKVVAAEISRWRKLDLISGWSESYAPVDESVGIDEGYFNPQFPIGVPSSFNPREELVRRLECSDPLWSEGVNYYRGKICFGMYSTELVERIKSRLGSLFVPLSPDYSTTAAALALANNAVDIGQPIMASFLSSVSTGMNSYGAAQNTKNFIDSVDSSGKYLDELPFKGVYSSAHNCVAGDYQRVRGLLGADFPEVPLNVECLSDRVFEELCMLGLSEEEKFTQLNGYLPYSRFGSYEELAQAVEREENANVLNGGMTPEQQRHIYESMYMRFMTHLDVAKAIANHYNP